MSSLTICSLSEQQSLFFGLDVDCSQQEFSIENGELQASIEVKSPKKWDSEHPNLYTLVAELHNETGELLYSFPNKFGFREVEIKGNQMFVNGEEIKLRGACRHDIHPTLGRMTTPEYDLLDVQLALESNINFIRTI